MDLEHKQSLPEPAQQGMPPLAETEAEKEAGRSTSSLKMLYEAQKKVISRQIGGLEGARSSLGLSRRKMCQLLMVDPSAWSRWTKEGAEEAPPHIFRALQWYLALNSKIPGLTPEYFLGRDPRTVEANLGPQIAQLKKQNEALSLRIRWLEKIIFASLTVSSLAVLALFGYVFS